MVAALIIPFIKTQFFIFKVFDDDELKLQLFSFKVQCNNDIFDKCVTKILNMYTFPIYDGQDLIIDYKEFDEDYLANCIQQEIQLIQSCASQQQKVIITHMKMISQYMSNMLIGIVTTLLCRLLKERKIHSKFIKKILTMLHQLNGSN